MPVSWRERVDTASAIKGILDSYPGNSILREILQNSDDAGATKQVFIIDSRQHGIESVVDSALKRTQGPALLAVNDSTFTESDWNAVRTIHGSNKSADETKTGKYGLGIRACYHITDNIHIFSSNKLVIFDPHEEFLPPYEGGVSLAGDELENYQDQLDAFSAAQSQNREVTVVRLPLRTPAEAARSKIKSQPVTISDMQALYKSFIANELSEALLFLKHIMSIELREITADREEVVWAQVAISNQEIAQLRAFIPGQSDQFQSYPLNVVHRLGDDPPVARSWRIVHSVTSEDRVKAAMKTRLDYDVDDRLRRDKLSSHIALAFPLSGQPIYGRLFTLLPLPISTGFGLQVHGIFALTPDRQSLRNRNEMGIGAESRERFLVNWNRAVFEDFLPSAWVRLIRALVDEDRITNVWSAWPPERPVDPHLHDLLPKFTKLILLNTANTVFPSTLDGSDTLISTSSHALVAAPSVDETLVNVVSRTNTPVVCPPLYIYEALQSAISRDSAFQSFGPQHLHQRLLTKVRQLRKLDKNASDRILTYLIQASPSFVRGLPLFQNVGGERISLTQPTSRDPQRHVLATSHEAQLFRDCDDEMIDLSTLPLEARTLLQQASDSLNVTSLAPEHLDRYLDYIFGTHITVDDFEQSESYGLSWFSSFWTWMDSLSNHGLFLQTTVRFHLLPTLDGTLRRVSSKAFLVHDEGDVLCETLKTSGVPLLHSSITSTQNLKGGGMVMTVDSIVDLLDYIAPSRLVQQSERLVLQKHLIKTTQSTKVTLNLVQRTKFQDLPVFPTRTPGTRPTTFLGPANGNVVYVSLPEDFPLPIVPGTTFVDVSKDSRILSTTADSSSKARLLGEVGIMELAVEELSGQPAPLQDSLAQKFIPRVFNLSERTRESLRRKNFIPTIGSQARSSPESTIDPSSTLVGLFTGEPARFPSSPYSSGIFLSMMQSAKLFCSNLTPEIVAERIEYISSVPSDPSRVTKAKTLLSLLSQHWQPSFAQTLQTGTETSWIPTTSSILVPKQNARVSGSGEHRFLFDLVLHTSCNVSEDVRAALGWTAPIGFDTLKKQFRATLELSFIPEKPQRLLRLVKYLAMKSFDGHLTSDNIGALRDILQNQDWIPFSSTRLLSSQHASLAADIKNGNTFHSIPSGLRDPADAPHCIEFLRLMGCTERPTVDSLLDVLGVSERLSETLDILTELSEHNRLDDFTVSQRERVLVPDHRDVLRHARDVYYNDMGSRSFSALDSDVTPAHPAISQLLASRLGLAFSSSLQLEDDDDLDVDGEDMSESLTTRIKNLLVEYDIHYSFNEFLANAVDANARHFEVLLDSMAFDSTFILRPEMQVFQQGPALVLFNDGTFTDNDFKGIRKIGEGGKQNVDGTIGKFGLGALSFYHFSEVAFIVSGKFIMILDPTASYLPVRRGNIKRRSLWRTLADFRRRYPDVLRPFDGISGFSSEMTFFPGTLIRLPLRSALDSPQLSNESFSASRFWNLLVGPYHELSKNALYFTSLESIVATSRRPNGSISTIWSVNALGRRHLSPESTNNFILTLDLKSEDNEVQQQWLIVRSFPPVTEVPMHLLGIVDQLKASRGLEVALAFSLDHRRPSNDSQPQYHLFSGLRLPETTYLPVHINAEFAISSDRRGIRFDPPDDRGGRVIQSEYNAWVLANAVPPLYLRGLREIFCLIPPGHSSKYTDWWPRKAKGSISEVITNAFYALVPQCNIAVLPTVTGTLITADAAIVSLSEPESVRELLSLLNVPNYVVFGRSITSLLPPKELRSLDANSLVKIMQDSAVEDRLQSLFSRFARGPRITDLIDKTLEFLVAGCSPDGHKLRLLATHDMALVRFDENPPTYYTNDILPNELFPYRKIMSNKISPRTQSLLARSPSYGVKEFDVSAVRSFVTDRLGGPKESALHSPATMGWIELFWSHFKQLPEDCTVSQMATYPLFATYQEGQYVSLTHCLSGRVLPDPDSSELRSIMHSLGVTVLRPHKRLPVDNERLVFSFKTFLQCLVSNDISGDRAFEGLGQEREEFLAKWIVGKMAFGMYDLDMSLLRLLAGLRLWHGTRNGLVQRLSANELRPLPDNISLTRINGFLDPNRPSAKYTLTLRTLWSRLNDSRGRIDDESLYAELSRSLRLPFGLTPSQLNDYQYLLTVLIRGHVTEIEAPDGQLVLRPAGNFFDSSNSLFVAAFEPRRDTIFVHPVIRGLQDDLPVIKTVTFEIFRQCAQAINDEPLLDCSPEAVARAAVVYAYYNDGLCFVPRRTTSPEGMSYDPNPYVVEHPLLVSPEVLLRDEFLSIAWTQRARFAEAPTPNLIAVHSDIGVPTAENVVEHLVVLATKVSRDHPHNRALVRDLKATYAWLLENRFKAGAALQSHSQTPIFLNVESIDDYFEDWQWRSAKSLVLNLKYDTESFSKVQAFLAGFRPLLTVAGAHERHDVVQKDEAQMGDPSFERLRAGGKLMDIELCPQYVQDDEISDRARLKAHAAFLAAKVPHVEDALTGGWSEGSERVLSFPGAYFGASSFLDLLYRGDIEYQRPEEDQDGMQLLKDLLELLPVAQMWDFPELRKKIGWLITTKYSFLQPETLAMIRQQAEEFEAPELVQACDTFAERNAEIMSDF